MPYKGTRDGHTAQKYRGPFSVQKLIRTFVAFIFTCIRLCSVLKTRYPDDGYPPYGYRVLGFLSRLFCDLCVFQTDLYYFNDNEGVKKMHSQFSVTLFLVTVGSSVSVYLTDLPRSYIKVISAIRVEVFQIERIMVETSAPMGAWKCNFPPF